MFYKSELFCCIDVGLRPPITLPLGFSGLPPTGLTEFAPYIPIANYMFSDIYNVGLLMLLTAIEIYGACRPRASQSYSLWEMRPFKYRCNKAISRFDSQ